VNVDAILISEYANNEGGVLTVVRCFNQILADQAPAIQASLYVSLLIHAHPDEGGTEHLFELRLLNARRELVIPDSPRIPFKLPAGELAVPGVPLRHVITVNMLMATFPEIGPYAFEAYIDDVYAAGASLYVGRSR
jgi:hypothetical protein